MVAIRRRNTCRRPEKSQGEHLGRILTFPVSKYHSPGRSEARRACSPRTDERRLPHFIRLGWISEYTPVEQLEGLRLRWRRNPLRAPQFHGTPASGTEYAQPRLRFLCGNCAGCQNAGAGIGHGVNVCRRDRLIDNEQIRGRRDPDQCPTISAGTKEPVA